MSAVELTICPLGDPTGTPVETWTDEDIAELRLEISLNDLGKNLVRLPRRTWEGSSLDARKDYYVRVKVPYIEATDYFAGFFLIGGEFVLVDDDENGGEDVTIGGPGPAWILTRAILNHEQWTVQAGVKVQDSTWYWKEKTYGEILTDLINEDAASDYPALSGMESPGWGPVNDADGNPWEEFGGIFSQPVGTNYLDVIRALQKGDKLDVWVTPSLNMRAVTAYGRDLTGASYGAGVVRFVGGQNAGNNVLENLTRSKDGGKAYSHVLVLGNDRRDADGVVIEGDPIHRWVVDPGWVSGDPIHQGFMEIETNKQAILERAGKRFIRRSHDRSSRMVSFEVMPGQDEGNGLYLPGTPASDKGNYWIGDTVTLKTGAGGDDFDFADFPVSIAKIRVQLDVAVSDTTDEEKERSLRVWVETGDDIPPSASAASSVNTGTRGGGNRLLLCSPKTACSDLTGDQLTAETATNGNAENGSGTEWSGGAYSTARKHAGSRSYEATAGTAILTYDFGSQLFEAGVRYVLDFWRRIQIDHDTTLVTFGSDAADEETREYEGVAGDDPVDLWDESATGADGGTWTRGRICWTPAADATDVRFIFQSTSFSSGWHAVDDVALYSTTVDESELAGIENRAARCDHGHLIETLLTAESDTGLRLAPDGDGGVEWAAGGGGGVTDHGALTGLADDDHSQYATNTEFDDHSARHETGGADALKLDDLAAPDDNTDLNASISAHGLLRKLDNDPDHYLDGQGNWTSPPGTATNRARKTADQTHNSTSFADVTGLTFAVNANTNYHFRFCVFVISNAAGEGYNLSVNGPAGTYKIGGILPVTSPSSVGNAANHASGAVADSAGLNTTTGPTGATYAIIEGVALVGGSGGTLALRVKSETGSGGIITIQANSYGEITEI